jgi:hypothetical protein
MDDALAGLIDVEHPDSGGRGFGPQSRQQFLPNLDGTGAPARRRNRMVGRRERQFRIMNGKTAALEVKEPPRATEIVQQMTVYVEKIGIIAKPSDDVLIPDLGQHGMTGACQSTPPFDLRRQTAGHRFERLVVQASARSHQSIIGRTSARAFYLELRSALQRHNPVPE